jgi:hypothetical protein
MLKHHPLFISQTSDPKAYSSLPLFKLFYDFLSFSLSSSTHLFLLCPRFLLFTLLYLQTRRQLD